MNERATERKAERRGLGRGLSALMADVHLAPNEARKRPDLAVPIDRVRPNPGQPRRDFSQAALDDLAASIREKGILQPLIVREREGGHYEIVAGERRWRAAQLAQLHEVPVLVRDLDDTEVLEIAIIENIQRADLNAVEEALGYRQLMEKFGHTQERMAEALGKSRSHIANLLRLLQLPEEVQAMLREGQLSAGHARALVTLPDPVAAARRVVVEGLSVRETERLAQAQAGGAKPRAARRTGEKDADTRALEQDLSAAIGLKVEIAHGADGSGQLSLRYRNLEDLDNLCRILGSTRVG